MGVGSDRHDLHSYETHDFTVDWFSPAGDEGVEAT